MYGFVDAAGVQYRHEALEPLEHRVERGHGDLGARHDVEVAGLVGEVRQPEVAGLRSPVELVGLELDAVLGRLAGQRLLAFRHFRHRRPPC